LIVKAKILCNESRVMKRGFIITNPNWNDGVSSGSIQVLHQQRNAKHSSHWARSCFQCFGTCVVRSHAIIWKREHHQ
jgi:hypothetical protein